MSDNRPMTDEEIAKAEAEGHREWSLTWRESVGSPFCVRDFQNRAIARAAYAKGLEDAAKIAEHLIEFCDDEEDTYLACNIENTIRAAIKELDQ